MVAVRQVQAAGDRVSQDGVQAQYVTFGSSMTSDNGFLNLRWTGEWMDDSGTYNSRSEDVTYYLEVMNGRYDLQRHDTVWIKVGTAAPTAQPEVVTTVARYLDASQMSCQWLDIKQETFAFEVVSVVGTKTEERTYSITPRPQH
jgi:hypothetical protein